MKGYLEAVRPFLQALRETYGKFLQEKVMEGMSKVNGLSKFAVKEKFVGRKALTSKFDTFATEFNAGELKTLKDVKDFRVYAWMLTEEQSKLRRFG